MARQTTLNVSLTSELGQYVREKVASGRYHSVSEVVREGLRLLEERDRAAALEEFKIRLKLAWQQSEQGKTRDGETVFTEQRRRLVRKLAARKGRDKGRAA